ncbi:MAG TPA: hypothetical protein VHK05_06050 [Candidatus Limnocylindrales bacterium]|nr:hypothetical protein [Candidatus Limnocylindrales bacterium]
MADQKPTTGTRAIDDGVGVGTVVGLGWGVDDDVVVTVGVGFCSGSDGCVDAQDITIAAIAAIPIPDRAILDLRTGPA